MTKAFKPNPTDASLFSAIFNRIPAGGGAVTITPDEYKAFGNLAGALNWAVQPDLPPAADGRLQYDEPTHAIMGAIDWGQSLRGFPAQMRYINALRFVAEKSGPVTLNLAEFQSPPTTYQCALSKTAGDLTGAREGNQPDASMVVAAGEAYFFNFRAWSRDIGRSATFEVQTVVVEGAWPA